MFIYEILPLDDEYKRKIRYNKILIDNNKKKLKENILDSTYKFEELFPLKHTGKIEKINVLKAYKYILKTKTINKETLHELYKIISNDLLDEKQELTGYYRNTDVCILNSKYDFDKAMSPNNVEDKMNKLFEYINTNNSDNEIDEFIKAQIIHFYLVYIHPYNDCNGRTARTLSMWYLLNNNLEKYIVANRAILKNRQVYLDGIRKGRHSRNITQFLNFILEETLNESIKTENNKIKLKKI